MGIYFSKNLFAMLGGTAVSAVVGMALLVTSPISCSCTAETLYMGQIGGADGYQATRRFVGTEWGDLLRDSRGWQAECVEGEIQLKCIFWTEKGLVRKAGHEVTFAKGQEGRVASVSIARRQQWAPYWVEAEKVKVLR